MLVIRRKAGDSILIGEGIELTVLEMTSNRVTLGLDAPPEILILRKELYLSMKMNKAAATAALPRHLTTGLGPFTVKEWN